MRTLSERFGRLLDTVESRLALYLHGATIVASFGISAWAAWAANIFSHYAPISWVAAGFIGVVIWALIRLVWNLGYQIKIRAQYDAKFIEHGGNYNPLDLIFERRRIYLNDFVLPSHPYIDGKTFVDCDIIGPANVYWYYGNQAAPIRPPVIDALCLHPDAKFNNGFIFTNCVFRNCSFQRITVFAGAEYFPVWKNNTSLNFIGIEPTREQIEAREKLVGIKPANGAPDAKTIEHEPHSAGKAETA